jgi:5-methylcytosine-specific restriction protein B
MHEQIIYFGAPGTGKSHIVKEKLREVNKNKIFRVTIHPEYTYSDFVGQILPEENPTTRILEFPFKKGPFTQALIEAHNDSNQDVYLVLEELSRGNVAAIFGDIFQLLDRNEYFISKYPIRNKNIADQIVHLRSNEIVLPSNFNIICTVNVNDQNVFPMDTAFKRRFEWIYVSSKPAVDEQGNILTKLNNPKIIVSTDSNSENNIITSWQSFYTALNIFITDKERGLGKSEDKQLGQFFIDFGSSITDNSHSTDATLAADAQVIINNKIKNKLLLYLWQDVQGSSSLNTSAKLFAREIRSFDDLYSKYGNDKVFSDSFVEEFLRPNRLKYPY